MRSVCPKCAQIFPVPPPDGLCPNCSTPLQREADAPDAEQRDEHEGLPSLRRRL